MVLPVGVIVFCRFPKPIHGLGVVLLHTLATRVHHPKGVHRRPDTLLGGLAIQTRRLCVIPLDTITVCISIAKGRSEPWVHLAPQLRANLPSSYQSFLPPCLTV